MSLFTHVLANALMTEATSGDIREAMDKLAKVQRTDREIAEHAVDLSNAQQEVLRTLWAAVKESQARSLATLKPRSSRPPSMI